MWSQGVVYEICSRQGAWLFYSIIRWIFQWPGSIRSGTHVKLNNGPKGAWKAISLVLYGSLTFCRCVHENWRRPPHLPRAGGWEHLLLNSAPWRKMRMPGQAGKERWRKTAEWLMWLKGRVRFFVFSLKFLLHLESFWKSEAVRCSRTPMEGYWLGLLQWYFSPQLFVTSAVGFLLLTTTFYPL